MLGCHWFRLISGVIALFVQNNGLTKKVGFKCLELIAQLLLLPICMWMGFYRFVPLKRQYYSTGLAQELMLH